MASIGEGGGLELDILHISLIAWEERGTAAQRVVGTEGENHCHDSNRRRVGMLKEEGMSAIVITYRHINYIYIYIVLNVI
jgi:hypothetical protein